MATARTTATETETTTEAGTGTATGTAARVSSRRDRSRTRIRESPRLRLTPYFLLLALPLAFGVWAFANYAAGNARDRADTELRSSLGSALDAYRRDVSAAAVQARRLARRPDIQRALRDRDAQRLQPLVDTNPNLLFRAGGRVLAGHAVAGLKRVASVSKGDAIVGSVVASVPLDEARLAALDKAVALGPHQQLLGLEGRRVTAGPAKGTIHGRIPSTGDLRIGGAEYRAATSREADDMRLAVAEPRHFVSASEDHARRRILLAGLAILGGVAILAYALAPALARTRVTQAQRVQAQQVLSHVGDGVFLVDHTGTISFWNPGAEALTGLPAAAALNRKPEEIFRRWPQNAPRPTPLDERPSAETGQYEVNGTELWLSVSGVDSPIGTVYAFRDRTEEYRLEEARADFVATVSHELRTPLASIHGAANTLRSRDEHLLPETRRELLEIVFEQSERLHSLVDQILLANQLSSGSAHVERRSFDAAKVARDAVNGMRPALPARVDLDVSAPETLPDAVGDPDRVRQVLVNLLENASKYSPGGGRIEVVLAERDGHVRFAVRDQGLGIPRAEQERIFQKFYRLDAAMTRGVGGSGLGLFISRELVSLMDGLLTVDSEPGIGSTFSFELPSAGPASAALGATGA